MPVPDLTDRRAALAERSRASLAIRRERFELSARPILHTALAAAGAWLVATEVVGHDQPFFAPASAVITLGLTVGQRRRRAAEVAVGVAVGILVADALVSLIGTGAWQLGVVVGLAMVAALVVGGGPLLAAQAAISAVLVVTIQQPGSGISLDRFYDSLVGGAVALIVSSIVLPVDPVGVVRRRLEPLLQDLAALLEQVADALERRDGQAANEALLQARSLDPLLDELHEAVAAAGETARTAPARRRAMDTVERHVETARQAEYAYRNTRVLARGVRRAIALHDATPPAVTDAIRALATASRELVAFLDDPDAGDEGKRAALHAAALANAALDDTANMSVSHVVAQIRSTATDFLRAYGVERDQALEEVRAAGPA